MRLRERETAKKFKLAVIIRITHKYISLLCVCVYVLFLAFFSANVCGAFIKAYNQQNSKTARH